MKIEKPPFDYDLHVNRLQVLIGCDHSQLEARYKVTKEGKRMYFWQCANCGMRNGQSMKKDQADEFEASHGVIRELDEGKHQNYLREYSFYNAILKNEQNLGRDASWWAQYDTYLKSVDWQVKRLAVFKRANSKCEKCLIAPAEQVHHLTYANVGQEFVSDLLAVCRPCHEKLHLPRD